MTELTTLPSSPVLFQGIMDVKNKNIILNQLIKNKLFLKMKLYQNKVKIKTIIKC